ncbi:MAG: lysylphosphatidylglycerol synthase transmembrane domain-containing protein [Anaerobutyricum soehngenii]|uniref:Phosphatidylglycerol lysyltransferase n=1 Tax=Roseburia intestinalis TaxID=166486 RepID=A0A413YVG4_9FIRM|nr:lysylphosphatidylglycerol synthase transmembrane domain-containing protein [Roseburia intestinalis]RHC13074.1 UPF0104 family protein [Roseburia intestinalis]UQT31344.1 flippase-like domain-containing protein [Roseburia intestinalis]
MLIIAIVLVCLAHFIRTLRWELFVKTYEKPNTKNLLQSLSIGYFINSFIPFKAGDLVRAWISGRKMKNGRGFALATVIVDRYLDILVVGILFAIFSAFNLDSADSVWFYMFLAVGVLAVTVLVYILRGYVKRILKNIAGIFNAGIEIRLLRFFWSLIWSFKDIFKKISKTRLLLETLGMWILYLASYYCFAAFLSHQGSNVNWLDVFYMLFTKNSIHVGSLGAITFTQGMMNAQMIWTGIYLFAPIVILFVISLCLKSKDDETLDSEEEYLNLIPQLDENERLNFLETYFSNERREYIESYLKINQNILIIRDYSAGSNATTMLCMNNGKNFFRKYAFGADGDKLYQQIEWLQRFKDIIPLPDIMQYQKQDNFCYYDMPYDSQAVGLFDYAHSMPKENAWKFIKKATECLENSLYKVNQRPADKATIDEYIKSKVNKNLDKIMNAKYLKRLMEYDKIIINGRSFHNLPYYLPYLSEEHLYDIFKNDTYSEIHGDLTIENIICTRNADGEDDFYIIDPNTGNIHDSSNLDYGKLLQSIHGGYEFLMATKNVSIEKNRINFVFTKSEAYTYLYDMLDKYMRENFEEERVKSIYYHEIIHWLRLMPYKIEKNGKRVLLFYAGMLMVMYDVVNNFEEEK